MTAAAPSSTTARLERSRTFHSLAVRNFRLYFVGQIVSFSGNNAQIVANGWLVLQLTNSGTTLGVITALQYLPTVLAGAWAMRVLGTVDRLRMLKLTQSFGAVLAFLTFGLVVTGTIQVWSLGVIAFLFGVLQALDQITRQLLVGEMVGPDRLANALGLNNMLFGVARIAGPAAAALVIGTLGIGPCFLVNAISYGALLLALQRMRPTENHYQEDSRTGPDRGTGSFREVLAIPAMRAGLIAMALIGALTYEYWVTTPLLVHSKYHQTATMLGVLLACMSVGTVVGGLVAGRRRVIGRNEIAFASAAFGVTTLMVGLMPTLALAFVATFLMGMAYSTFLAWGNTSLQLGVALHLRARVIALRTSAMPGLTSVGAPFVGWVGERYGASAALELGGVAGIAAGAIVLKVWGGVSRVEDERRTRNPVSTGALR